MDLASWEKRMKILIGTQDWNHGKCICKENLRKISRESQSWTDVRRWSLHFPKGLKHCHRRNVTSHNFLLLIVSKILVSREFSRIFFYFHFSFSISSRFNFTFTSRKRVKGFYFSLFTSRKK